jgi:hypothetical protein
VLKCILSWLKKYRSVAHPVLPAKRQTSAILAAVGDFLALAFCCKQ